MRRLLFDLWYFFRPPWDTGVSPPELLAYLRSHKPGLAVDLGCGTGTNVITLAAHGWNVTGVDFSATAIARARRRLRSEGLSAPMLCGDITDGLSLRGPFDLALDIGCFHSVVDRQSYLETLASVLRDGGDWLLYTFIRSVPHEMGLGEEDLHMIAEQGFQVLHRADGFDRRRRPSAWFLLQKERIRPSAIPAADI